MIRRGVTYSSEVEIAFLEDDHPGKIDQRGA
jgi:hypothetical protein